MSHLEQYFDYFSRHVIVYRKSDQMLLQNYSQSKDQDIHEHKAKRSRKQKVFNNQPRQQGEHKRQNNEEQKVLKSEINTLSYTCSLQHLLDTRFTHVCKVSDDATSEHDKGINCESRQCSYDFRIQVVVEGTCVHGHVH